MASAESRVIVARSYLAEAKGGPGKDEDEEGAEAHTPARRRQRDVQLAHGHGPVGVVACTDIGRE